MFYGLYNKKPVLPSLNFLLTRKDVLDEDSQTPWLTTNMDEAMEILKSLSDIYAHINVAPVMVSALVPWKLCEHRM